MRLMASFVLGGALVTGADLSGLWIGRIPAGRQGALQDITFKLAQNGTTLTGKLYGDYRSGAITEGSVLGDEVSFVATAQEQFGNEIINTRLKFTGSFKDGELELTRQRDGATTAGNGDGAQLRANANAKITFRVKKLY